MLCLWYERGQLADWEKRHRNMRLHVHVRGHGMQRPPCDVSTAVCARPCSTINPEMWEGVMSDCSAHPVVQTHKRAEAPRLQSGSLLQWREQWGGWLAEREHGGVLLARLEPKQIPPSPASAALTHDVTVSTALLLTWAIFDGTAQRRRQETQGRITAQKLSSAATLRLNSELQPKKNSINLFFNLKSYTLHSV